VYTRAALSPIEEWCMAADADTDQTPGNGQHFAQAESNGRAQSNSKRFVYTDWGDGINRELCAHAVGDQPQRTPISGRTGLATARWTVVEREEGRELICNRLHNGPCLWPWHVGSA
jgi:hypothetical protein